MTNGDDASIVNLTYATKGYLSNTKTNDVGDYDINTGVNELKNYDVKTNTAKLHINKAALFVNTDDKTTTYGTVDKAFTSDIQGLTNGDDASIVNLTYATKGYLSNTKTNDVGDYDINTSVNELKNYDVKTNTAKLHINKAALFVNTDDKTTTYGTVDKAFTSDIQGLTNGDDASIVNLTYATKGYLSNTKTNDVGDYDINTSVNELKNYDVKTNTAKLHINKAALFVNTDDKTTTYGTVDKAFTSDIQGLTNGDDASIVNLTYATKGYLSDTKTNDVGDYDINTGVNELKNYDVKTNTAKLHINKAALFVNTDDKTTTYGTVDKAFTSDIQGLTNGDDASIVNLTYATKGYLSDTKTNDVGDYDINTGVNELKNYDVKTNTAKLHINKAALFVNTDDKTTTYGTVDKAFTSDIQGLTNGDDASIVNLTYATKGYLSDTKTNDVGDYDITTSVNELKNYDVKTNTAKLHINKAALFVNTDDKTTTYGTVDKAFTSDIQGLTNGDDASIVNLTYATKGYLSDTKTNDVGDYDITTSVNELKNYDVKTNTAKLHINKAALFVNTDDKTTTYGTVDKAFTSDIQGLTNGDDASIVNLTYATKGYLSDTKTNDVGDYDINTGVNELKNYDVKTNTAKLHINKAALFVNTDDKTTTYGTVDKAFTSDIQGLTNGDDASIVNLTYATKGYLSDTKTNDVGDYDINTGVNELKNYDVKTNTAKLHINKAALFVNTDDKTTTYGTVDKAFTSDIQGLTNGDDASIVNLTYATKGYLSDTKTNDVGDYDITTSVNELKNYDVKTNTAKLHINKAALFVNTDDKTTTYGTVDKAFTSDIQGLTNGDDASIVNLTYATKGYLSNTKTNDVGDYDITTSVNELKNYDVKTNTANLHIKQADLTIQIGNASTVYGTKFDESQYGYKYKSGITNGDTKATLDAALGGMNYTNDAALDGTNGKWTKGVGDYDLKGKGVNNLTNYKVTYLNGTATVTPYTITEEEIVNPDGSPLYTTKYGQKDAFGTATFTGVNGDGTYELAITDSSALATAGAGKVTQDVGKNIYDTTVELSEAMNGNYQFADGATSKTFEKTASVTPAELTIKTKDVETEYGTVKTTTSEVEGLVNGDLPTGFIYDYGDYGGAYLDSNTKTNDVNTYHFGTKLSGAEFLKNYTITGGEADVKIDPKDVTFFVSGTGNTLDDITYTVDPDIDAQLAYGEHVDADYTPGNTLGDNQYGVVAHINGTPIISGDVAGNYRYNYGGLITLSPTVPTKPDIDPHNPSNLDGSGSWTSNMGKHGVPGVERVAGLASAELPFFKVEAGQVSHYGTYDVAADPDKVRLEPTGKRLPEPNQPKTQYREYTKALTTTDGTGMFRMVYDGSTFNITPVDDGALALMRMGDVKNNVELSAEALHAGFSEMGILLEDLDGVYVHFDTMA
ncbi:MBG domain-containing protein [Mitsuokella multacida]|uniref:MBG domain-containing protein n=1 Tax=Mitsuokella multacida TaxID=52226 RepID=UPI003F6F8BF1